MRRGGTSSNVTGFCMFLAISSIVFLSSRRSFFRPTRMIGSPWQKCSTSEIHCNVEREREKRVNGVHGNLELLALRSFPLSLIFCF